MLEYFSILFSTSFLVDKALNSLYAFFIASSTDLYVFSLSVCAPPNGSLMIPSINFCLLMSLAVSLRASAAISLYSQLLQRIEEHDSGDITVYQVFSSINTLSPTPIPTAPPEAPSPITIVIIGVFKRSFQKYFLQLLLLVHVLQLLIQDMHQEYLIM